MTKRTTATLTFAAGCILGGFIGFIWHAPGRASTWADARGWATFVVVVLGLSVAAYELNLQRRQFAEEAKRNTARDDLLDRQRHELQVQERLREREQAERVDLTWSNSASGSYAELVNDSRRPLRDVACQFEPGQGRAPVHAERAGELKPYTRDGTTGWIPVKRGGVNGWRLPTVRGGGRAGFDVPARRDQNGGRLTVRFADDVGLLWQLDHDLHLVRLDSRDDW